MDVIRKLNNQPILKRSIIYMAGFSLLYMLIIRPVRVHVNDFIFRPKISQIAEENNHIMTSTSRRIDIKIDDNSPPSGFGIPFGGYFWLPFSLFFALRYKSILYGLISYHFFLLIVPPALTIHYIRGHLWAKSLLAINETVILAIFLLSLFFGIKIFILNG